MNYGFVYILANIHMPAVYKIGCTERSPHARAEELSKATGVPSPFYVLCYAESTDFQALERDMHKWCDNSRISANREFFTSCFEWAAQLLKFNKSTVAFVVPCENLFTMESGYASEFLSDPWRPIPPEQPAQSEDVSESYAEEAAARAIERAKDGDDTF